MFGIMSTHLIYTQLCLLRKQGMQLLSLRLLSVFKSLSFAFSASWTLTHLEQLLENSKCYSTNYILRATKL